MEARKSTHVRLSGAEQNDIDAAAKLKGTKPSTYIRTEAVKAARRCLAKEAKKGGE